MASSGGNGPSTKTSTTQVKEGKGLTLGLPPPPSGIELLSTVGGTRCWRDGRWTRRPALGRLALWETAALTSAASQRPQGYHQGARKTRWRSGMWNC